MKNENELRRLISQVLIDGEVHHYKCLINESLNQFNTNYVPVLTFLYLPVELEPKKKKEEKTGAI